MTDTTKPEERQTWLDLAHLIYEATDETTKEKRARLEAQGIDVDKAVADFREILRNAKQ